MEGPFTHMAISNEAAMIREQTRKFIEQLRNSEDFRNGIFDPAKDISFYPFLVVATVLYGDLDAEDIRWLKEIAPVRQKLFTYVIRGGVARFSLSRFLPTTANRLLMEFQREWLSFNEAIYEKTRARGAVTPMVKLWEDCQAGKIPQVRVRINDQFMSRNN
jgi:AcrR family transcriptional regulator